MPEKMHDGDAGFDLYSAEDFILFYNDIAMISTGITVEIPYGYEM